MRKFSEPSDPRFLANAIILIIFHVYRKVILEDWVAAPDEITNFLLTYESEIKTAQEYIVLHYVYGWNQILLNQSLADAAFIQHDIIKAAKLQLKNKTTLLKLFLDTCEVNHYMSLLY